VINYFGNDNILKMYKDIKSMSQTVIKKETIMKIIILPLHI